MPREATLIAHNDAPDVTVNQPGWRLQKWRLWLLALGLVLRVGYALSIDKESSFFLWDGREFYGYAQSLLAGQGDNYPHFMNVIRPPFYSLFLIPFIAISDNVVWHIQIAQCVLGVLQAVVLGRIASRWAGQQAGNWAFALALFNPFLIYYCAFILTETLFILLLWTGIGCLQRLGTSAGQGRTRWLVCAAVGLGLACLTRPALQLFLPVAALWLAWTIAKSEGWPTALRRTGYFALLVAALLLPWMVRNFAVHRSWSLAPRSGEAAYTFANSPEYLAMYEAKSKDEYYLYQDRITRLISVDSNQSPEDWMEGARDFRKNHSAEWWRLQWYKFRHFWTPWVNPLIFPKREFLLSLFIATPPFLLAAAELIRRRATRDPFLVLLGGLVLAGYVVGGFLFHVQVRYRIPFVDVTFLLLSACFLAHSFQRILGSRSGRAMRPATRERSIATGLSDTP